jgi:LPS O-antigen subunit length determinant protein (WzzB/FepE family)
MKQKQDDEIDLFELFENLWAGKWLIIAIILTTVLFSSVFLYFKVPVYQSKLIYSVDTIPPFYDNVKAVTDFKNRFFSKRVFENWKKNNNKVSLVFDDISNREIIDGFVILKGKDGQLAQVTSKIKNGFFVSGQILIKTNQLSILNNFFKYANYVNDVLKLEYVNLSKNQLKKIETRFMDLSSADSIIINSVLQIDSYIVSAENGARVIIVQHPTMPKKISPKSKLILGFSVVLGGIAGLFLIIILNVIKMRNKQLAKAHGRKTQ